MYIRYPYPDELYHYGVKGMKWGIISEKPKLFSKRKRKSKTKKKVSSKSISYGKTYKDKETERNRQEKERQEADRRAQDARDQAVRDELNRRAFESKNSNKKQSTHGGGGFHSDARDNTSSLGNKLNTAKDAFKVVVSAGKKGVKEKAENTVKNILGDKYYLVKTTTSMAVDDVINRNKKESLYDKAKQEAINAAVKYVTSGQLSKDLNNAKNKADSYYSNIDIDKAKEIATKAINSVDSDILKELDEKDIEQIAKDIYKSIK